MVYFLVSKECASFLFIASKQFTKLKTVQSLCVRKRQENYLFNHSISTSFKSSTEQPKTSKAAVKTPRVLDCHIWSPGGLFEV